MGNSIGEGKEQVFENLKSLNLTQERPITVFEAGPGNGNYKDRFSPAFHESRWLGVEVWMDYIKEFDLVNRYDILVNMDVRNFIWHSNFDVAFFGDILEHMEKEEAVNLIAEAKRFCRHIYISIPIILFHQGPVKGNPYEEHIKPDWSHKEVMETWPEIVWSHPGNTVGVYRIDGIN